MRVKLQLVLCSEDGREETVTDIVSLNKGSHRLEHLGLTLAEAKQLLKRIQTKLLEQQIDRFLDTHSQCPDCGAPLKAKSYTSRSFRTLFGTCKLPSPRLFHCPCQRRKTTSFRPLSALLTESVAPELLFIEAKWSSLASYGLTVKALKDFLPLDATLAINTVRHDTLKVAERLEAELGEERWSFIAGCPRDWAKLPIPDGPITVGIDGGYVRSWEAKKTNFEVIVGKSTLAFKRDEDEEAATPSSKRFGFVQTEDTKSKRRLYDVLTLQGFQLNQQITFLSDGEDAVRNLQLYMSPEAEHILDWWHVTQKLTVLDQYGKGLVHCDAGLGEEIREKIARLKWALWHGNVYKALKKIDDIESLLYNFEETYAKFKQLLQAIEEFRTYIRNNAHLIPHYGERYRNGEAITTSFVESTVNQVVNKRFCKKQQMQWSKRGAHLLLQARVKTLNREWAAVFKQWYPDLEVEEWEEAA
jgi:hypothetical protein